MARATGAGRYTYSVPMGRGAFITLLALAIVAAPAQAATRDVTVQNNTFTPADITVTQGDAVTWTFAGPDTNHSVTSDTTGEGSFDSDAGISSPNHAVGDKFSKEMSFPGEFTYYCKVHAMKGRVVVQPKTNNPNPPPLDTVGPKFGTPVISSNRRKATVSLDEPAEISVKLRGPTRKVFDQAGRAGTNIIRLPKMKPGRYALVLRAEDRTGNRSVAITKKFRVAKR